MERGEESAPAIEPSESYQIDSDEFESDEDKENVTDELYNSVIEEAEHGFSEEQVAELTTKLKERGLVNFLRDYLTPTEPDAPQPSLRKLLLSFGFFPPSHLLHTTSNVAWLPYAKLALSRMLRHRQKLLHINTVQDAVNLLRDAKKVIVLSGAGISTSCGIPDFRSASGLYAQLQAEGKYDLDEPQDMFDIRVFRERPEIFYSFAKQIYPSNFTPSPCHRWIRSLEDRGILLRNYTQNIDTLESSAGVKRVLQCHGSFSTASCLRCKTRVPGKTIEPYIMSQQIPFCGTCRQARDVEIAARQERKEAKKRGKGKGKVKATEWDDDSDSSEISEWGGGEPGIIKPDIVFFGQALDSEFDELLFLDRDEVDLLVIIGTSLKVAPVAEVLTHIPHSVPQIFINLTPVNHVKPDICLIGDADSIVTYLSHQLGWDLPPPTAVLHSPKADGKPDVQHDAIRLPTREPLDPEDVAWISGSEDLAHIHLLTSKADLAARGDAQIRLDQTSMRLPGSDGSDDDTPSTGSAEDSPENEQDEPPEDGNSEDGASQHGDSESTSGASDDHRPAKKTRLGDPP